MNTVDLVIKSATTFYNELKQDENGRYRSWEYCYYNFYKARRNKTADIDYLCLQLAFYLASWGMYRGSSFLLQKDYKIHIPVVMELLQDKYDVLFGMEIEHYFDEDNQRILQELNDYISRYYDKIRRTVKTDEIKSGLSATLVTKVLMGTMGCVPAYDRYFISGVKNQRVATGNYNMKSILSLATFYKENYEQLEEVRKTFIVNDILYPQMKLIDMGFWQIGADVD